MSWRGESVLRTLFWLAVLLAHVGVAAYLLGNLGRARPGIVLVAFGAFWLLLLPVWDLLSSIRRLHRHGKRPPRGFEVTPPAGKERRDSDA